MGLRQISDIHQIPVLDLETGDILGQAVDWVVDPAHQKIAAYVLSPGTLWHKTEVIVPVDIVEYGPKMIIVRDQQAVITPDEIVGLPELLRNKVRLRGAKVESESGKNLGVVEDFTIEIIGSTIQQYYIQSATLIGGLANTWVVSADKVIRVEQHKIILPDTIESGVPVTQQQTQAV